MNNQFEINPIDGDGNNIYTHAVDGLVNELNLSEFDAKSIINDFIDSIPEYIGEIETAISVKDFKQIRFCAHKLKGGASNLRLEKLASEFKILENYGATENLELSRIGLEDVLKTCKGLEKNKQVEETL